MLLSKILMFLILIYVKIEDSPVNYERVTCHNQQIQIIRVLLLTRLH